MIKYNNLRAINEVDALLENIRQRYRLTIFNRDMMAEVRSMLISGLQSLVSAGDIWFDYRDFDISWDGTELHINLGERLQDQQQIKFNSNEGLISRGSLYGTPVSTTCLNQAIEEMISLHPYNCASANPWRADERLGLEQYDATAMSYSYFAYEHNPETVQRQIENEPNESLHDDRLYNNAEHIREGLLARFAPQQTHVVPSLHIRGTDEQAPTVTSPFTVYPVELLPISAEHPENNTLLERSVNLINKTVGQIADKFKKKEEPEEIAEECPKEDGVCKRCFVCKKIRYSI